VLDCAFEWILCFSSEDSHKRKFDGMAFHGGLHNVITTTVNSQNAYSQEHKATFPLYVPLWIIEHFSFAGQTVIDPCVGTGTTLRAAKDLGRQAIGIEIEEKYCEIAVNRLRQEVFNFT